MHVTPQELGAIVAHFDRDCDGTVDCAEFMASFFELGKVVRNFVDGFRAVCCLIPPPLCLCPSRSLPACVIDNNFR